MGIYARRPWRFLGQLATDIFVVVWAVAWWLTGAYVDDSIASVAKPARETANATEQMSVQLQEAGTQVSQIPGIGDTLRRPFDTASQSLSGLRQSADQQVASIERLASIVGWLVFVIPVAVVLIIWLPRRIGFLLRARAAQRFIDSGADLDLFALRAMANQPMQVLAKISDDPVRAWRTGDVPVIRRLAETELRRNGLTLPEGLQSMQADNADEDLPSGPVHQSTKS